MIDRKKDIRNEPNMRRHPDMFASEVIAFTDDSGRIKELEVHGSHAGYEEASTWMLLFVDDTTTFRMASTRDNDECELTGLDVYAPESLLSEGMPEGITSMTLARGDYTDVLTLRGTRRAIREYIRNGWTDGSDDAEEQISQWMDLVTPVDVIREWE